MKKIICLAFSLALLIFAVNFTAFAASRESENNNDFTKADLISVNETVTGNLANGDDSDWYKFTLSKPGYVSVSLDHVISATTNRYWCIQIFQADGVTGVNGYNAQWNVIGSENFVTNNVGIDKGTYYIRIFPYSGYTYVTTDYNLTVNFTASAAWETESNSSYEKADKIAVNKEYSGCISGGDDVDWYCFTLDSDGVISVDFNHVISANDSSLWEMHLYRSNGTTGLNDSDTYWRIKGSENLNTCSIGLSKGDYYIKITPYSRYSPDSTDYKFKVNFNSSAAWEKESNDSYEKATDVPLNTDFNGSMCKGDDNDWYRFTLAEAGGVTLSFNHPISATTDSLWKIYLYSSNGTDGIIGETTRIYVTGDANCVLPPVYLDAGTYYFRITTSSSYTYSTEAYSLRLGFSKTENSEIEPNGSYSAANSIETDKEYLSSLLVYSDIDYYKFTLDSQSDITVVFYRKNENETKIELTLYESNGTTRVGNTVCFEGNAQKSSVGYEALGAGTYYIKIEPYSSYQPAIEPYGMAVLLNHGHVPNGEWNVTSEPGCTRDGKRQCLCSVCGAIYEEAVPAEGHEYGEWIEQYAPTCEYKGYQYRKCTKCGDSYGEYTPSLGHNYGGWIVTREATCSVKGVEKSVCGRCGDSKTRYIDMTEHTFGEPERIEGNIFDYPMIYKKECVNCGYYETYEDNKARWAAPVIIAGSILILAGLVLFIVLYTRKSMKTYAAAQNYPEPPVVPSAAPTSAVSGVNADGSVNCVCGQINSSDATFCCACGRRLKGQEK